MIQGIKTKLVYHLYIKSPASLDGGDESYFNVLNQRILSRYSNLFDSALFCVVLDDVNNGELIEGAVKWILGAGPWNGLEIKIKPNSPFNDAQTFFDEIVNKLDSFKEMVMFGHNKGTRWLDTGHRENVAKWVAYSYFSIFRNFEENVKKLADDVMVTGYVPIGGVLRPADTRNINKYGWHAPGGITMFNPMKLRTYLKNYGEELPILSDRFSQEFFWGNVVDIKNPRLQHSVAFDGMQNQFFITEEFWPYDIDHTELIGWFLPPEEVKKYKDFYDSL